MSGLAARRFHLQGWEVLNYKPFITITGWYFTFQPLETLNFPLDALLFIFLLRKSVKCCCSTLQQLNWIFAVIQAKMGKTLD